MGRGWGFENGERERKGGVVVVGRFWVVFSWYIRDGLVMSFFVFGSLRFILESNCFSIFLVVIRGLGMEFSIFR